MSESISGLLQTSGEISVAFVGFASLIGVFVARSTAGFPLSARLTLRALIDYGLLALSGCAIPLILHEASVSEATLWRASSAGMAFVVASYYLVSRTYYREVSRELVVSEAGGRATIALLVGDGLAVVVLCLVAIGVDFELPSALYLLGAVYWNAFGAAMSFRLVIQLAWSGESE